MSTTASASRERVDGILRAACRVVAREGAHGLRMATVAAEAGVSKALVHYYFATRQELLRSAFAFSDAQQAAALDAELEGLLTGRARIERVILAGVGPSTPYAEHRSLWNEVWGGLRDDDELRPLVVERYRAWIARIVSLLEQGLADGSIAVDVAAEVAGMRLAALADGLDSMLYLGLVSSEEAEALAAAAIARELDSAAVDAVAG